MQEELQNGSLDNRTEYSGQKDKKEEAFCLKKEIFETCEAIVFAVVTVVFVFTFLFRIVGVNGPSMKPTVQPEDRLIISHLFYQPEVGDIVVINHESFDMPIIKRIIAMEGDTVEILPDEGKVLINGQEIQEPYINELTKKTNPRITYPLTVPEGQVFVMGDNRMHSSDSRDVGCIDVNQIVGRAILRIYPFNSIGLLE